jgi:carbon storage regulator
MLVLSRKIGEKIHIGDNIVLTVVQIRNGSIRLGVDAPVETPILRGELVELITSKSEAQDHGQ